jgi:hypothetical protein
MRWGNVLLVFLGALAVAAPGCGTMLALRDAAAGLLHLQFKLDGVQPGTLAGVSLAKVSAPASVSPLDGLKLTQAFLEGSWPLTFTVDVAVKNPNDGRDSSIALLESLAWTLQIDGKETISGDIPDPIEIPGSGETRIVPLAMSLDLYRFFGEEGYEGVLNLALAVAGAEGTASRIALLAVPTVSIGGVAVEYPGAIRIVDKEFTNP